MAEGLRGVLRGRVEQNELAFSDKPCLVIGYPMGRENCKPLEKVSIRRLKKAID